VPASLYRQRYPALAQLDAYYAATNGVPPEGNVIARNICAGGKWLEVGWHARPAWLEVTNNLVEARPGFVDPDKMDFSLRPDSPAFALGFQPIPTTRIGLQNDDDRRELKRRSTGASGAQR
jgi:hypothetical protein